jgi:cytochrome c oxidase subunit 4
MNTAVALTIASIKALMVVLVFMHLRHSTKLTWIIASAGFLWLGIMMAFTFADYLTRNAIPEAMKDPLPPAYSQVDIKLP